MLTSHPSTGIQDRTERTKEEHSVLGRAMQILNDNPILKAPVLQGSLAAHNEELHMTQTTLNLDDLTKIWTTFQNTLFRPSICYLVTPVRIDSAREEQVTRVMECKIVVVLLSSTTSVLPNFENGRAVQVMSRLKYIHMQSVKRIKEEFVRLMRLYEKFCEVRKVTYCIMSNHFHVNVEVGRKLRILLPLSSVSRLRLSR